MLVKLLTEHHMEFLSLKGGCRGSSESTLVKMLHCLAQIICNTTIIANTFVNNKSIDKQDIIVYQSPLILIELFQHNLINVSYLTACYLYQVMMTLHFLNDVANDAESTQKSKITS